MKDYNALARQTHEVYLEAGDKIVSVNGKTTYRAIAKELKLPGEKTITFSQPVTSILIKQVPL